MDTRARIQAARIISDAMSVWDVAIIPPTVRVRVRAASKEQAKKAALALSPQDYAEALVRRLQHTRPKHGDIVGAHRIDTDRPQRVEHG